MSQRSAFLLRAGAWLSFLVLSLGLSLTYLLQAPDPVGTGLLHVFGFGALSGAGLGAAVRIVCAPLFVVREWIGQLKVAFGCVALGAFGGAGGGAWIDQLRVVDARTVELPIVRIEPDPRRSVELQMTTLSPLDPTGPDHVAAEHVDGSRVREGDCLVGTVERGWLGGAWVRRYAARPCSRRRRAPGSHVLVSDAGVASWRWHTPRNYRIDAPRQASDEAVPAGLVCRMRSGDWLYRCTRRRSQ